MLSLILASLLHQPVPPPSPHLKFADVSTGASSPNPAPGPRTDPSVLTSDVIYIPIQSDAPFIIVASPSDLVTITKEQGPMKVRAKFSDGNGKYETRQITSKYFATVEAAKTGTVELIAIPVGAQDEKDIVRKTVQVQAGQGPQPPPPTPNPSVVVPIPGDGLRVLIVEESADRTKLPVTQQNILFSKTLRDYLDQHCPLGPDGKTHEWRIWDKDSDASNEAKIWQDALKRPRQSIPWIIVSNGKDGYEGPLPLTVGETLTLLKKYGGQ